jgi:hypothetical protein
MFLCGLAALAVSASSLLGPTTWNRVPGVGFGWIVVIAAIVVGLVLILSPGRRRK